MAKNAKTTDKAARTAATKEQTFVPFYEDGDWSKMHALAAYIVKHPRCKYTAKFRPVLAFGMTRAMNKSAKRVWDNAEVKGFQWDHPGVGRYYVTKHKADNTLSAKFQTWDEVEAGFKARQAMGGEF